MRSYTLSDLTATVPMEEFLNTCVDVEKFLGYCKQCPNYGKIWACPPHRQDPMDIWKAYGSLTLYARVLVPGENMTEEELLQAFRQEKLVLSQEVLELERQIPGSRSMAASTCLACSPCLRTQGKPCCHPEQLRYSIEALGGDVGKIMETYLHKPICWIQKGKLPPYLTLVAGLLRAE